MALSFDETSGTIARNAASGSDGVVHGAQWTTAGKHAGALSFDGSNDRVTVPNDQGSTDGFSVSAWVRPRTLGVWSSIVTKQNADGWWDHIFYAEGDGGKPAGFAGAANADYSVQGSTALPANTWRFVTLTSDGQTLRYYVDGTLDSSVATTAPRVSRGELHIGGNTLWGEYFDGLIDDLRVYDQPIDATRITADQQAAVPPVGAPEPTVALSFDEGAGAVAGNAGAGNDGVLDGGTWMPSGRHAGALSFDGQDDRLTIPNDRGSERGFAISAWVQPRSLDGWNSLVTKETSAGGWDHTFYANEFGKPSGFLTRDGTAYSSVAGTSELPLNSWSHVTLASDGETLRLYRNGNLESSVPAPAGRAGEGPLQVGSNTLWGEYFDGLVDDLRVYDRPIGDAQIANDRDTAVPAVQESPPVVALAFDEVSGSVAQNQAGEANGVVHGATRVNDGRFGKAMSFDGSNDYIEVPGDAGARRGFTLSAWVRPREVTETWRSVITKETDNGGWDHVLYASGATDKPEASMTPDGAFYYTAAAPNALAAGQWQHLAVTSDGQTMRLYVGGELVGQSASGPSRTSSGTIRIGGNQLWGEYFDGAIDEVRVYNRPIGSAQLEEDMETRIRPVPNSGRRFVPTAEAMTVFEQDSTLRVGNPASPTDTAALTTTGYGQPDLSPDGKKVVTVNANSWVIASSATKMFIAPATGGTPTEMWSQDPNVPSLNGSVKQPRFSPDGEWIIYSFKPASGSNGAAIWKMRTDGSSRQQVVDWAGDQTWPAYNPAGTQLTFMSTHKTDGTIFPAQNGDANSVERAGKIFTSTTTGSSPVELATSGGLYSLYNIGAPTFSPEGSRIAFHAQTSNPGDPYHHIYVTKLSDNDTTRVSYNFYTDGNRCIDGSARGGMYPSWAPDGTSLIFQTSWIGACRALIRSGADGAWSNVVYKHPASNSGFRSWVRYRQPSGPADHLAQKFRPLFYFDTDEHWRPLEVNRFMAEDQNHQVCIPGTCNPLTSPAGLAGYPFSDARIDIAGDDDEEGSFTSPDPACNVEPLRDCNSGGTTAAYYDSKVSPDGYRYLNYWWFYRFNDAGDAGSPIDPNLDHEGDWENMSVAIPWSGPYNPDPSTFDFVVYGQHGHMFNYLKANVACDGQPHNDVSGGGKPCTQAGRRPHAFVAEGTHATYPDQCGTAVCGQNDTPGGLPTPEQQHDGAKPWGRNADGDAFIPIPPSDPPGTDWAAGNKNWVDWPGNWGETGEDGHASPESPARQWQFVTPWANPDCADGNDPCASNRRSLERAPSASASCDRWFGPSATAALCSPSQLSTAVRRKKLRARGTMRIRRDGKGGRRQAASAPGLAQLSGPALKVGQRLTISARVPRDAQLYVRARDGRHQIVEARFARRALGSGRTVIEVARSRGGARARTGSARVSITAVAGKRRSAPVAVRVLP